MQIEPQREQIAKATKWLLIANIVMFAVTLIANYYKINLYDILAIHYFKSAQFKPWQFITHMFMHGSIVGDNPNINEGFMHLFMNMFALWMFGSVIENYLGTKRFIAYYFLCGIGAALLQLGMQHYNFSTLHTAIEQYNASPSYTNFTSFIKQYLPTNTSVNDFTNAWKEDPMNNYYADKSSSLLNGYYNSIIQTESSGASGAIFGILLAFGYIFPNAMFLIGFFIPLKAKYVVIIYAIIELVLGLRNSANDNIGHFAHFGGLLTGLLLLMAWRVKRIN
jgi:membrane associated rhomboid family serine protease